MKIGDALTVWFLSNWLGPMTGGLATDIFNSVLM